MKRSSVQRLARALRVLVIIFFVLNIITVVATPMYAIVGDSFSAGEGFNSPREMWDSFISFYQHDERDALFWLMIPAWLPAFGGWQAMIFYGAPFIGGICTAVILWQGKRVLDTVLAGEPFSMKNAANLRRAAVCCFVTSGAALARLIFSISYNRTVRPLLTNYARFVPAFFIAGLLCMVVSALFRQAAELKAENDLTI